MTPSRHARHAAFAAALASACVLPALTAREAAPAKIVYPPTQKVDHVDTYHGVAVPDPYRWLEETDSPQTHAWVEAQNKVTFAFLEKIAERPRIEQRLTKLWNYERYSTPWEEGGRYFFSKNDGLQNQSVIYTMTALDAEPRVLIDPNKLSSDGTVALSGSSVSDDGRLFAYGLSTAGSDWQEWRVRDVETGQDLPDHLRWVKFSGASWTKDGKGFFYSRYDEPAGGSALTGVNYFQKLYHHRLGAPQADDALVYERKDQKEWGFGGRVTDDGRYLVINVWHGTDPKNRVFYKDLRDPAGKVVELLNDFDASYNFIDNDGSLFWFHTDLQSPRGRIIGIDVTDPARDRWRTIVPEAAETLTNVNVVADRFLATYLKDAQTQVKVVRLDGSFERLVDLPAIGSASGFSGKRSDKETFYAFTGFTTPTSIYRYDVASGRSTLFKRPTVDFDHDAFETKQIFYTSKDRTRVPMFIVHKKGLQLDGGNPTYLYGYGGFNVSLTPSFSVANVIWLEMGGVFAQPNLRGGGEYGEDWHQAGTKLRKQNVFDDFIAAAEWLIANKYTSPRRLAIGGGSNGGLLVGACMTQRPDLFGATLPAVGVMDMLRFHKFTIGWAWTSDYGSSDDPEQFRALRAYSPLHNLASGVSYPATLVTTADHDDRVVPGHSFKFAAALQAAHAGPEPVLIRIETRAGHGAGKPTAKIIEEQADRWAFLVESLDMDVPAARPAK